MRMFRSRYIEPCLTPANILLALFCLFALVYLFFSPSLATPAFQQDTFFILSDGWRFANGQIPYKDYYSPLGPLSGLLTGLGMLMIRPGSGLAHSVLIGQGIFLTLMIPITVFAAYRRLRAPLGALFCFIVVSLVASRVLLGDPFSSHLTVTGTYNSQGYALLLVFSLMVLLRPLHPGRRTQIADDLLGGFLLLLLFFDKISYFGVAGVVLVAAAIVPRLLPPGKELGVSAVSMLRMSASFLILTALVLIVFKISPASIADDISRLLKAQAVFEPHPTRAERTPKIIFDFFRQYALLLFGFPLLLRLVFGRLPARHELVLIALGVFLAALSMGLMQGNLLQAADLFLVLLLGFVWTESFTRNGAPATVLGSWVVTAFLVLTVLQHQAVPVLSTVRAAVTEFRSGAAPNRWLAGTGLADLIIPPDEGAIDVLSTSPPSWGLLPDVRQIEFVSGGDWSMYELSQVAFEGQCLLYRNSSPADRILTDWTYEIFSLMRPQPPPLGGSLGYGLFDVNTGPKEAREAFAGATVIMTPRNGLFVAHFAAPDKTRAVLQSDFSEIGQSRFWSLWRRKGTSGPPRSAACPALPNVRYTPRHPSQ
jgi:hypothetical protein